MCSTVYFSQETFSENLPVAVQIRHLNFYDMPNVLIQLLRVQLKMPCDTEYKFY